MKIKNIFGNTRIQLVQNEKQINHYNNRRFFLSRFYVNFCKAFGTIIILLTYTFSLNAAEVILKDGKKITGKVISEDATQITISETAGAETKILKTEVVTINYEDTSSPDALKKRGFHTHDGFFLRMLAGYSHLQFNESPALSDGTGTIKMAGLSALFGFHIGYAIAENLILLGSLHSYAAIDLKPELNGVPLNSTVGVLGVSNFGAGLCYYFMPINIYLSADVSSVMESITTDKTYYSEPGIGANFQIGKEWWVSDNWGLGAAIFAHYSSMKDKTTFSIKPDITNLIVGLAFSATYN